MTHTIPMQFFRATVEALSRRDIDSVHAVRESGLDWQKFDAERSRMTPEQATAVVRKLWEQTDDELLGIGPRHLPRGSMRLAGLTVIHSRDLRSALTRIAEFASVTTNIRPDFTIDDEVAILAVRTSSGTPLDPIVAFSAAAVVHRFAAWLIDTPITIDALHFPFDASHLAADYEIIFGTPATFAADELSMSFSARLLDRPIVKNESDLKSLLRDAPGSLFYSQGSSTSLESRVRRILERAADSPWMDSTELAGLVFMSASHMRRRLREEGASVRAIQDDILRDRAIDALVNGDESIADIAARLGYSEPSSFRRAFHRWTGCAPIDYRTARSGTTVTS